MTHTALPFASTPRPPRSFVADKLPVAVVNHGGGIWRGRWTLALEARRQQSHVAILFQAPDSLRRLARDWQTLPGTAIRATFHAIALAGAKTPALDDLPGDPPRERCDEFRQRLARAGYLYAPPYHVRSLELLSRPAYDFAIAFQASKISGWVVRSLAPVYIGHISSFLAGACDLAGDIEKLGLFYEQWEPYVIEHCRQKFRYIG